jgi:hypothetical protein
MVTGGGREEEASLILLCRQNYQVELKLEVARDTAGSLTRSVLVSTSSQLVMMTSIFYLSITKNIFVSTSSKKTFLVRHRASLT